ncbi:AIPR family protein [Planotetraspora sp. A-T 1434]|uniref:AIPR family protein n=1 Tax=Planotetraspora sp. A-T 1434 TaxID=2979219 RepID=UPI0021BFBCEC|nr:AIPR family protein [Planotetraspora sp. A-T 1434]MCT9932030.1 AIPR family protein [Planotetraspora sp. A-T 1434]
MRTALLRNYSGLIYEEDLRGYDQAARDQRFLSRALAADAVRIVTGCDHEAAGRAVIDGDRDQGIDAIAVGEGSPEVWLVQAKSSDAGTAKLSRDDALAFADGVRLVDGRNFDPFNDRMQPFLPRLDAAMGDSRLRITLVVALMGPATLSDAATGVMERLLEDANNNGPLLRYEVLGSADFYQRLRQDIAPDPVNVTATMRNWLRRDVPFEAWQGTVAVRDLAGWYEQHRDALYEQNVRKSLGLTRINSGIKETLLKEPENFWYFNNGITVLCDRIEPHYLGRRRGDESVRLTLEGVSVVNGAQTVTAIHEAMELDPDAVDDADVTVRAFSLGPERELYATRITETTNTQNDVSQRDFIALDPAQAEIREDFLLSGLGKTYTYKRGEPDPAPEAGCSVEHAAVALACAYHSPELAVRASKNVDLLWERGTRGAYPRLFSEVPSAYRLWRSVQVRSAVGAALELERRRLHGRAADMARRGDLLITHLVFQLIDQDGMDDPNLDWQPILHKVPTLTSLVLSWMIFHLDAEFGRNSFLSSTFSDETRCKTLAKLVLDDARRGATAPALPEDYQTQAMRPRKPRRPNAVPTLVSAGLLVDGTPLTYRPQSDPERAAVKSWLAEDPRRDKATWVNDRVKCLLWTYDGKQYSATGLVQRIWDLAGYEDAPVSVQGPGRWTLENGLSLWDFAVQLFEKEAEED